MGLINNRKGIGGRKAVALDNPFIEHEDGEKYNLLDHEEILSNQSLEDLIVGCISAFTAEKHGFTKPFVDKNKLISVYRDVDPITRQNIQDHLECSLSQAKRYIQVIKLTNVFLIRWVQNFEQLPKGYIDGL
jgi:hypothetical protein